MQKNRHPVFQQMAVALSHQQNGKVELALAYWENLLRIVPDELRIQHEILAECTRIVEPTKTDRFRQKLDTLLQTYQQELSDEDKQTFQAVYRAMVQQCGENYTLALVYWKDAVTALSANSLVITLGVQDLCWNAHQYFHAGKQKECFELYEQTLQTFPEFFEGYINHSILRHKIGQTDEALFLLRGLPAHYQNEFIIARYIELYQQIQEVSQQFDHVPYAAIEPIVNELQVENTFYPSLAETEFSEFVEEIINREKGFFEKRRKALEEKTIAKTSKRLAEEGLALGERVTLAKQAKSEDIPKFLYDNEIRIAEVLLNNPNMTQNDVLIMAQVTHVSDILTCIAEHWKWRPFQNITLALLLNPQTLPAVSIRLLQRLSINDLATVFYKKNIPTEVRIRAKQRVREIFDSLSLYEKCAVIEASSGDILKLLDRVQLELPQFIENLVKKFAENPEILINICRWKLTPSNVLSSIGNNKQFTANTRIAFALLSNPRTPMGVVISLIQKLEKRHLRLLMLNKYIPASVKQSISSIFPDL